MKRFVILSIALILSAGVTTNAELVYDNDPVYEMEIFARFDNGTAERFVTRGDQVKVDATFTNLGDPVSARLLLEIYGPGGGLVRTKQVVRPFTVDRPVLAMPQLALRTSGVPLGIYSLVFHAEVAGDPETTIGQSQTLLVSVRANTAFIGFMGYASVEDLDIVQILGAEDVAWGTSTHSSQVEDLVDDVTVTGLELATRAPGRTSLQDYGTRQLDFTAIRNHLEATFLGNDVAGETLFHYMIDEFCHPDKWDIPAQDLADLHSLAKSIDPRINIFHNAGHLGCFKTRMDEVAPEYPVLMDYVGFTVTPAKLNTPGYLELIDSIAGEINEIYGSQTRVIALYAVCDSPERWTIPTPEELVTGASQVLAMENIHGIGFYPWGAPAWSTVAIRNVCEDPAYIDAFNQVFDLARERFGGEE